MRIPIGDNELGVMIENNHSAYFFTLNSSYYYNILMHKDENYRFCTFSEFKVIYPIYCRNVDYRYKK